MPNIFSELLTKLKSVSTNLYEEYTLPGHLNRRERERQEASDQYALDEKQRLYTRRQVPVDHFLAAYIANREPNSRYAKRDETGATLFNPVIVSPNGDRTSWIGTEATYRRPSRTGPARYSTMAGDIFGRFTTPRAKQREAEIADYLYNLGDQRLREIDANIGFREVQAIELEEIGKGVINGTIDPSELGADESIPPREIGGMLLEKAREIRELLNNIGYQERDRYLKSLEGESLMAANENLFGRRR